MTYKWEHCFPYPEFRSGQDKTIDKIITQFEQGKKFVLAEMPTGMGKSAIGFTVGKYFDRYYYITAQKILQSQLSTDFGEDGKWSNKKPMIELKGRNAYPCNFYNRILRDPLEQSSYTEKTLGRFEKLASDGVDCDCGECKRKGKSKFTYCNGYCPYWIQVQKATSSPATLMNFHNFLFQTELVQNRWDHRTLLIIDECQNAESVLMDYISIKFNDLGYDFQIPELESAEEYLGFFEDIDLVGIIKEKLEKAIADNKPEDEEYWKRQILKYKKFKQSVTESEWIPKWEEKHVVEDDLKSPLFRVVELKPLYVKDFAHDLLFNKADYVLMMSATILSVNVMCDSLGINRADVWATRTNSDFPVENRPIIVRPSGSMSFKCRDKTLPKLLKDIEAICQEYAVYRGIIHTHNFMITDYIIKHASKQLRDRLFYQKDFNGDKDEMLKLHANSNSGIIIAPAMHEGLDLKGELSRFQIVCKMPYPPLKGDPQLERRIELSDEYYQFLTALKLVQCIGRSVRSKTDWAKTYVLDSGFVDFITRSPQLIPKWIKEAIVYET